MVAVIDAIVVIIIGMEEKLLGIRNFVHHFYSLPLLNNLFENNTLPEKSSVFFNEYDLASLNDQLDWS